MEPEEESVIAETVRREEEIELFDWEDHLYESWLEEQHRQKRKRSADAGVSV